VIRQAISCDLCGAEKKQTNHWFVAYEHNGELRVSGWSSRLRLRPGTKHLCGQTCLHKLMDDFMDRSIAVRMQSAAADEAISVPLPATIGAPLAAAVEAAPAFDAADLEVESSARLLTPPPSLPKPAYRPPAALVTMPSRPQSREAALPPEEPSHTTPHNRRTEAWERERERERAVYARERKRFHA
jgi:hypothetical protein